MADSLNFMIAKINREHEHFEKLKARGLSSLSVADQLIHVMLEGLEIGFKNRNPGDSDVEIKARMKHHVDANRKRKEMLVTPNG